MAVEFDKSVGASSLLLCYEAPSKLAKAAHLSPQQLAILIGSKKFQEVANETFKDISFVLDERVQADPEKIEFVRDAALTRLDGTQLIPYSFIERPSLSMSISWDMRFRSLLPPCSNSFIAAFLCGGYGKGLNKDQTAYSLDYAKRSNIPVEQASSSVEGGNCFLFMMNDKRCAIVGCHSLVLSLLALEEQGYFVEKKDQLQNIAGTATPSDWAVRMARNVSIIQEREREPFGRWFEYKAALQQKISEEDRKEHCDEAALFEAKMALTKEVMARELGVETLAIVQQKNFHIDMDLFVGPNGVVYIQDEKLAQRALREMATPATSQKIARYCAISQEREDIDQRINEENIAILTKIGCIVVPVPGVYGNSVGVKREQPINFINCLSLKFSYEHRFIAFQASEEFEPLQKIFAKTVLSANPKLKMHFLKEPATHEILRLDAGLHCITREIPLHETHKGVSTI